jgi:hypothetical protein
VVTLNKTDREAQLVISATSATQKARLRCGLEYYRAARSQSRRSLAVITLEIPSCDGYGSIQPVLFLHDNVRHSPRTWDGVAVDTAWLPSSKPLDKRCSIGNFTTASAMVCSVGFGSHDLGPIFLMSHHQLEPLCAHCRRLFAARLRHAGWPLEPFLSPAVSAPPMFEHRPMFSIGWVENPVRAPLSALHQ